jgi:hypothetical protein
MPSTDPLTEFRTHWLPHATDAGIRRLIELLERVSPLLIHGAFTRAYPTGCLATHLGWHHPQTEHLQDDAGICWLTRVAGLNPATSLVILRWDQYGHHDRELRGGLLDACREELDHRASAAETDRAELACSGAS